MAERGDPNDDVGLDIGDQISEAVQGNRIAELLGIIATLTASTYNRLGRIEREYLRK